MGVKYSSIHISTTEPEKYYSFFDNYYNRATIMEEYYENDRAHVPKLLIVVSERFLSIYGEDNGRFSNIDELKAISRKIDAPFIYTANFDDDYFLVGIIEGGEILKNGVYGEGLREYGLKSRKMDWGFLEWKFGVKLQDHRGLEKYYKNPNISKRIFIMQHTIGDSLGLFVSYRAGDIKNPDGTLEITLTYMEETENVEIYKFTPVIHAVE